MTNVICMKSKLNEYNHLTKWHWVFDLFTFDPDSLYTYLTRSPSDLISFSGMKFYFRIELKTV